MGNINYCPETQIADIVIRTKDSVAMYEESFVRTEISVESIHAHIEKSKQEGRIIEDKEKLEYWHNRIGQGEKIRPQIEIDSNARKNLEFMWKYFSEHIDEIPEETKKGFEGLDEKTLVGYYIASRPETGIKKFIERKTKEEEIR